MAEDNTQKFKAIQDSELKLLMGTMSAACDVVRVVDPATFEARTLNAESGEFNEPYKCYSALCGGRRCQNCISMRAVGEGGPVSKFEFADGEAYFITARPIEFEGRTHTLEVVQKVHDSVGLGADVASLQSHVQAGTDSQYTDGFTGAYSRNYFEEGLSSMRGRKLALIKVANLAQINDVFSYAVGDAVLKRVAHALRSHTRIEDSVIHYEGNEFAVQFEDMDSKSYPDLMKRLADSIESIRIESHPDLRVAIRIVAIDEDGSFGELARKASEQMEAAETAQERLVIRSSNENHSAVHAVRTAEFGETLHRADDVLVSSIDDLTGLLTSTAMRAKLQELISARHARSEGYCIIYLDIENFKQFNRTYERQGGDLLLKFVADRIRKEFPQAQAARMGADIFLVVTDEDEVAQRIERIREAVASYQRRIACELKAGVLEVDEALHDVASAIDVTKVACESIKGHYDRSIRFYDSILDQEISMNEYVVNNIDRAIAEGHITIFYQPIIRTMTGHVSDFEALCRWDDPEHGLLPPGAFIGALERFHLISKLDECMVRQVCQHQAMLLAEGKPVVPISVNLSRLDFNLGDVFEMVESAVAEAGIPRKLLTVEVTESVLDDDAAFFSEQLERFRSAGYEVWMDDFGSGYSSLNLLKDYRFDTLKIDMGFLTSFDDNPKSREIIVTVVDMAKKLGIRTLIEGVETKQQYRFLQRIGCEMLQGFYFAKPHPYNAADFADYVLEEAGERAYLDELGSINLLGLATGDADEADFDDVTESESRSTPMAIVEHRDASYRYLSANETYMKLIENWRHLPIDEVQERLAQGTLDISNVLFDQLEQVRITKEESAEERVFDFGTYQVLVRHVASGREVSAFAVVPVPLA